MSTRVAIAGIGELPQGRSPLPNTMTLHERLALLALEDAQVDLSEIDALLTVAPRSDPYLIHAAALAEHLGITPAVTWTLEAGGAAPAAMVETARGLIANGTAHTVLIVAADMPLGGVSRNAYVGTLAESGPVHPDIERPYGPSVPAMFATVARAHMAQYGTSPDHLAAVAIQNRAAAARHPNAHYRDPIDLEAYQASRMIADPLRLLDCAPVSDGGGAVVVTSADRSDGRRIEVLGSGFATTHLHLSAAPSLTTFGAGAALERALAQAGMQRADIDLLLVYDCFTIALLINLADLGFVEPGAAGPTFAEGRFGPDGDLPVNPHGGLLSHGHPARAGGMGQLIEAVTQLRGMAGERQVARAEVALVHGMGGVFATHGVSLLARV
jgi:acetyl-CoA acetyltransferase